MRPYWKLKIALLVILGIAAMTALVMWLWNWLVPDLFGGRMITYWQALGLMLLTRILFRGFFGWKGRGMHNMGPWKQRWEKMSPEEREKMKELWKKRCGSWRCDEDQTDQNVKDNQSL